MLTATLLKSRPKAAFAYLFGTVGASYNMAAVGCTTILQHVDCIFAIGTESAIRSADRGNAIILYNAKKPARKCGKNAQTDFVKLAFGVLSFFVAHVKMFLSE